MTRPPTHTIQTPNLRRYDWKTRVYFGGDFSTTEPHQRLHVFLGVFFHRESSESPPKKTHWAWICCFWWLFYGFLPWHSSPFFEYFFLVHLIFQAFKEANPSPDAPCMEYLHIYIYYKSMVNVDKYSSPMEHLGSDSPWGKKSTEPRLFGLHLCGLSFHLRLSMESPVNVALWTAGSCGHTWRIIPFNKWLITMVSKSPKWGCSPSKWPKWLINTTYTNWDDPPSRWYFPAPTGEGCYWRLCFVSRCHFLLCSFMFTEKNQGTCSIFTFSFLISNLHVQFYIVCFLIVFYVLTVRWLCSPSPWSTGILLPRNPTGGEG